MKLYTATLIITKHLEWLDDKKHCPKVNEEKLKEAIELLTNLVKKLSLAVVVERSEQLKDKQWLNFKDYLERYFIYTGIGYKNKKDNEYWDSNKINDSYKKEYGDL